MGLYSTSEVNLVSGAAGDIFGGIGQGYKAKGYDIEAAQYREAARFATLEGDIQNATTSVSEAQAIRQGYQGIGKTEASLAGAGFSAEGSGGDILRSSTQQAHLQAAMAEQSGQVAEMGFREQAKSYTSMAEAADVAAEGSRVAQIGSFVTGGLKLAAFAAL